MAATLVASQCYGCASVVAPYQKGQKTHDDQVVAVDESAKGYCSRLATTTDSWSQQSLGWGIVMSVVAGATILAGAAMGPDTGDDPNWIEENRNTLTLGLGALIAVPATVLLMRSQNASAASAAASLAMAEAETDALKACLKARADFAGSRSDAATFVRTDLTKRLETLDAIKKESEAEAAKKREAAKSASAEEAKKLEEEAKALDTRAKAAVQRMTEELLSPP